MMRIIKKIYDSDDIQSILNGLNADEIYRQRFMEIAQDKMGYMDFGAIKYVVRDGFAESFTRFDSDVCEQFLNVYELCVKKYYN